MANHDPTQAHESHIQDLRDLYQRIGRTEVNVAALQSGLENLSRSTEAGFENISNEIKQISNNVASSRPNFGAIAGVLISAVALTGALVGFALKATVSPMERDITAIEKLMDLHHTYGAQLLDSKLVPVDRRLTDVERRIQTRYSDNDDRQDAELRELQRRLFLNVGQP